MNYNEFSCLNFYELYLAQRWRALIAVLAQRWRALIAVIYLVTRYLSKFEEEYLINIGVINNIGNVPFARNLRRRM